MDSPIFGLVITFRSIPNVQQFHSLTHAHVPSHKLRLPVTMTSILSLPNEIVVLTATHIQTSDINSLATKCRSLHNSALPALYRTNKLDWKEETVNGNLKVQCLLRAFADRPRTAGIVRSFGITVSSLAAPERPIVGSIKLTNADQDLLTRAMRIKGSRIAPVLAQCT